jgi:hypothetical protein
MISRVELLMAALRDEVDEGEDHAPADVDEVPVAAADLHVQRLLRPEPTWRRSARAVIRSYG